MKLVVAIVHIEDSQRVSDSLTQKGYGTTRLPSHGTFLGQDNHTLFTGVADERVPEVISIIRSAVHWRRLDTPGKTPDNSMVFADEAKITMAGATIFVLDVDQFLRV